MAFLLGSNAGDDAWLSRRALMAQQMGQLVGHDRVFIGEAGPAGEFGRCGLVVAGGGQCRLPSSITRKVGEGLASNIDGKCNSSSDKSRRRENEEAAALSKRGLRPDCLAGLGEFELRYGGATLILPRSREKDSKVLAGQLLEMLDFSEPYRLRQYKGFGEFGVLRALNLQPATISDLLRGGNY